MPESGPKKVTRQSLIFNILEGSIILASLILALSIAVYNRGANDDHLEVSKLLLISLDKGVPPEELLTCWECYQPKLFHFSVALLSRALGTDLHNPISANLLNCFCWFMTCIILTSLIRETFSAGSLRLSIVAFCWLNPSLITVGVQATNDAFVMLFGSIALRFITWPHLRSEVYVWTSTLLALFSKGSALVLLSFVFVRSVVLQALHYKNSTFGRLALSSTIILALTLLPFLLPQQISPYGKFISSSIAAQNLQELNFEAQAWPPLYASQEECRKRPENICSILDGFLSFRLMSLVEAPKVPRGEGAHPPDHMRSVWTTVYARYFLPVFPQHFWRDESALMDNLSRLLAVIGLFPLALLLLGFLLALRFDLHKRQFWTDFVNGEPVFHLGVALGLLAMLTTFNLSYQWHPGFKEIYLFCGVFSFWCLFLRGLNFVVSRYPASKHLMAALLGSISLLWFVGLIKILYDCV